MSLIKLNNRAVKDVTEFGSISQLGSLTHISTATASASASIEFSLGDYKEYQFYCVNIHPSTDNATLQIQASTNNGSSYGVTATTTAFQSVHRENDTGTEFIYNTGQDVAQSTSFFPITNANANDNDLAGACLLTLFNPSSTTYVKHFIANSNSTYSHPSLGDMSYNQYTAGYFNDINDLTNIKFQMSSGNIDAGQILLFGVN